MATNVLKKIETIPSKKYDFKIENTEEDQPQTDFKRNRRT